MKTYLTQIILTTGFLLIFASQSSIAQDDFKFQGQWAFGIQNQIAFHQTDPNIGYVSSGATLITADFSDPLQPVMKNTMIIGKLIFSFVIVDNYLYVTDPDSLWTVSIEDPETPVLVGTYPLTGLNQRLYHLNEQLFVVGSERITVFNMDDRQKPSPIGMIELPDIYLKDLAYRAGTLYGATSNANQSWMLMIDITNLQQPILDSIYISETGYVTFTEIVDSFMYIGSADSLAVWHFENDLLVKDTSIFTGWVYDMTVEDTIAFVTRQGHGIHAYSIRHPEHPYLLSSIRGFTEHTVFRAPFLYGFDGGPIDIHDYSDPNNPQNLSGEIVFGSYNKDLELWGDHVVVAQSDRLVWLDIPPVGNPTVSSMLKLPSCVDIEVFDTYLLVANLRQGWSIVDASDINAPLLAGNVDDVDRVDDIEVNYPFVYITGWSEGIIIYDISDIENPVRLGQYQTKGDFERLLVRDTIVYAFERNYGLRVLNVSDPHSPYAIDSVPLPGRPTSMEIYDQFLYIGISGNSRALNITDPAHPIDPGEIFYWQTPRDITWRNDTLYVAELYGGLHMYLIDDPANPQFIASLDETFKTTGSRLLENQLLLLDEDAGLFIYEYAPFTTQLRNVSTGNHQLQVFPNPATSSFYFTWPELISSPARLKIYDTNGRIALERKISGLVNERMSIDIHHLSTGTYFVQLRHQGNKVTTAIIMKL